MCSELRILVIITLIALVHCELVPKFNANWFGHINREPPPPRVPSRHRLIHERWFNTKVNNFNSYDKLRWNMRYFSNDEHYVNGGPFFIFVGGEWKISYEWILAGHMYDMAKDLNGLLFYTEHRYYGDSHPTPDTSTENLQYLTSGQAIEDLAEFIVHQRATVRGAKNSKVILVGASYAGSLVTWIKQKYPDLVDFAWASSAPLHAQVDLFQYKEFVGTAIKSLGGEMCYNRVVGAFAEMEKEVDSGNERLLKTLFNLCYTFRNALDTWSFFNIASNLWSTVVQSDNSPVIQKACALFVNSPIENDMDAFANIFSNATGECVDSRYSANPLVLNETNWTDETVATGARQWFYQTCNEFGWHQTTTSDKQPFGSKVPIELFLQLCMDVFYTHFDEKTIYENIEKINAVRKGLYPVVKNVFFTHGEWDPWRTIGLQQELSKTCPVVVLSGLSHAADLNSISQTDTPHLRETKQRIHDQIRRVLGYSKL